MELGEASFTDICEILAICFVCFLKNMCAGLLKSNVYAEASEL